MKLNISRAAGFIAVLLLSAAPVLAQGVATSSWWARPRPRPPVIAVPEIDASLGIVAIACVLAAMLFVWERNRRAA